ncbi:serine/threonine protein kinase [Deinococcus aerius]|uniref:Serine/threonine protein kinase n=1 Tax=Deinococcus aerius TaxID=200253 RepID=A0A2I9D3D8_9DEIO|nr:serine/threonine protein kinase [Deinococcus aerius]
MVLIEEGEPPPAQEFAVSQQARDAPLAAHGKEALYEGLAVRVCAGTAGGQQGPHKGEAERLPGGQEQEDIDVVLAELPTRAVEDQPQVARRQKLQDEGGGQAIRERDLDGAQEALVPHGARSWAGAMVLEGGQDQAAGLPHCEDEGGQNSEAAGIHGKGGLKGGVQGIVWGSASRCLHRREHRTGADFLHSPSVLRGSQRTALTTQLFLSSAMK